MTSMIKRVDALEKAKAASAAPRRVIRIVTRDEDETTEAAIARWSSENPDQRPPTEDDLTIVRSIVSPPHRPESERKP